MAVNTGRIDAFLAERPLRQELAAVVRTAGFQISSAEELASTRPPCWCIALKLDRHLRELFGTAREIIVYAVEASDFQARTITQARDIIYSEGNRYSEDFAIILTADSDTERHVAETAATMATIYVGISVAELREFRPLGRRDFVRHLQSALFSKDLYATTTALPTRAGFFGRKELLTDVLTHLRTGAAHIGLFGLRKMGKTSVLFQIKNALRQSARALVSHIDLQTIDAIEPSVKRLLWAICEGFLDNQPRLSQRFPFRLIGQFRSPNEIPSEQVAWDSFDHDIRTLLTTTDYNLVLLMDEIELMGPTAASDRWGDTFVRTWRLLRGLSQQYPRRLAYFVAGTNPQLFETNRLGTLENPAYNFLQVRYLERLSKVDSGTLLVQLGRRMGLEWDADAVASIYDSTGGHPFLTRLYASRVHRRHAPRNSVKKVTRDDVVNAREEFLAAANSFLAQMTEVLQTQYEDEYLLLEFLASGNLAEFRQYAREFPDATAHLDGYGLIRAPNDARALEIAALQSWMQARARLKSVRRVAQGGSTPSRIGESLESYTLDALIGSPGGFAEVYSARDAQTNRAVAIKVFHNASLPALEREATTLMSLDHPGIVKVLDFGRAPDGTVFLVTELLSGQLLRARCDRSRRLSEVETTAVLTGLLNALVYLHPDAQEIEKLRRKDILTEDELALFQRKRHGYVHRDIKPENIILEGVRGPVLIDFGITSRAREPVVTVSCTPGYLPPDGPSPEWSPDVDLFQLGLTVIQACLGVSYCGDPQELGSLHEICRGELPLPLAKVVCRLSSASRDERYESAKRVLADLALVASASA